MFKESADSEVTLQPGVQRDAVDADSVTVPSGTDPGTEAPPGSPACAATGAPIASHAGTVAATSRLWVRRDPATGLFTGDGRGADPAVRAEGAPFEADLAAPLGADAGVGRPTIADQAA